MVLEPWSNILHSIQCKNYNKLGFYQELTKAWNRHADYFLFISWPLHASVRTRFDNAIVISWATFVIGRYKLTQMKASWFIGSVHVGSSYYISSIPLTEIVLIVALNSNNQSPIFPLRDIAELWNFSGVTLLSIFLFSVFFFLHYTWYWHDIAKLWFYYISHLLRVVCVCHFLFL